MRRSIFVNLGVTGMRLLIVEDNPKLAGLMGKLLTENGMTVDSVVSVQEALAALDIGNYDTILLDLGLPDGDGSEVLQSLRKRGGTTPLMIATARDDVLHRVQMLNDGADDYLVKPFSMDEFVARVRALLRRPAQTADPVLTAGNLSLDTLSLTVTVDGRVLDMPRRELMVLQALLSQRGRLLSRQKMELAIYTIGDEVTPNATEAAVSRLRRRLDQGGANVNVAAMRGLGYILSEPAE